MCSSRSADGDHLSLSPKTTIAEPPKRKTAFSSPRLLFTAGALAVIRYAKIHGAKHRPWLTALLARRPTKVAAVALANKIAENGLGHDGERDCQNVAM